MADLVVPAEARVHESHYYGAFARFISMLEGCTRCIPVGGARLGCGTPDVLGYIAGQPKALVPYGATIIAGELKLGSDSLRGFAQAYSYRLFAHKCYLAVPRTSPGGQRKVLEALCAMARIGLATYDPDAAKPDFRLLVCAGRNEPDMRLLNRKLTPLRGELFGGK